MRKLHGCDKGEFRRLESSEKTIAILGDRWPQTAKQDGGRISGQFLCNIWKKRNERPNIGGVSIRSRNGAPSRKGRVVNSQTTKASNKLVRPPAPPPFVPEHGRLIRLWSQPLSDTYFFCKLFLAKLATVRKTCHHRRMRSRSSGISCTMAVGQQLNGS